MKKNDPIVIEKIGNGWIVRPYGGVNEVSCWSDLVAFQNMQYTKDENGMMDESTLLGWIKNHFETT